MSVGICTECGTIVEVGESCPKACAADIGVPGPPPDFQFATPSLPAFVARPSLVLVGPPINHPATGVLVTTTAIVPAPSPHPVAKLQAWIDSIDTDHDGTPFYRDPDELRGAARFAWKAILFLAARLPDANPIGKGADGIVGAVDRSGFRGDVDKL